MNSMYQWEKFICHSNTRFESCRQEQTTVLLPELQRALDNQLTSKRVTWGSLSIIVVITMLGMSVQLNFSNTKASKLMNLNLHTHICHDALCPQLSSVTDLDLFFILG